MNMLFFITGVQFVKGCKSCSNGADCGDYPGDSLCVDIPGATCTMSRCTQLAKDAGSVYFSHKMNKWCRKCTKSQVDNAKIGSNWEIYQIVAGDFLKL